MRFLFTTLQDLETRFYGDVGAELERLGHEVSHVTWSRPDAGALRRKGLRTWCLPEVMDGLGDLDVGREVARIEATYDTPSVRDIYKTDLPCQGRSEEWCMDRTARHFLALERIFDEAQPDILVPEVGSETMRTAAHLIGLERGITVLFLMYTLFPRPLRLYANTMHGPIVPPDEVRELSDDERAEVEAFIAEYTRRRKPIRKHRTSAFIATNLPGLKLFARQALLRLRDRRNEYMRPGRWALNRRLERARSLAARALYQQPRERPFLYFPLHVTDDYKIKRLIPHCVDQASLIEQVADALPQGYDLVLKEHPMSVGRNSLGLLRRLRRIPNARLLDPHTNSHDLMLRSAGVVVISSTVGLEALMYEKPVLTMGQPFYSGYGVTLDLDSFREVREKVPELLQFRPDREQILRFLQAGMRRCYEGSPVLVDSSAENARSLATSLDRAAREGVPSTLAPEAALA
jgi:hypothetical protein